MDELKYWRVRECSLNLGADFADIGSHAGGPSLTAREYTRVERSCVRVLLLASRAAQADEFETVGLRLIPCALAAAEDFGQLSGEAPCFYSCYPVSVEWLPDAARLILRGGIWCVLKHPHLEVHFPGGCAMVIGTDLEFDRVLRRIERRGFSVEPVDRPTYEWEIGD